MRGFGLILLAAGVAAAQAALAHPGHGAEAGWLHFLGEPDHLAALAAAPLGVVAAARVLLRRRRACRP